MLSQGLRDILQEQDTRSVPWGSDVGENDHVARNICPRASENHNPPPDIDHRRQRVPSQCRSPAYVSSKFDWHRVRYVVVLVLIVGIKYRGVLSGDA